jgi:hemoglobin
MLTGSTQRSGRVVGEEPAPWRASADRADLADLVDRADRADVADRGDIADRADIAALLTDFYGRAFRDEMLGPIFVDIARMDLAAHLPVMCDFWETVLFHSGGYRGNALRPHQRLHERAHLTSAHFDRWLALWSATVDDRHAGPKAELAKVQATRIAGAMDRRITGRARLPRSGTADRPDRGVRV